MGILSDSVKTIGVGASPILFVIKHSRPEVRGAAENPFDKKFGSQEPCIRLQTADAHAFKSQPGAQHPRSICTHARSHVHMQAHTLTHNQAEIPLLSPPPLSRTRACELATKRYRGMSQRSNKPRGTGACRSAASNKPTRSI